MAGQGPQTANCLASGLSGRIKECAREAGFDLCGVAAVRDFEELEAFPVWIADGRNGEMKYMEARDEAGKLKRAALARIAPWARSVIVCAINYNTPQPYSTQSNDPTRGWISRYAWTREDYHEAVMRRLRKLEAALHELLNPAGNRQPTSGEPLRTRVYVDTGPLIERVFAKYAGVGWIGKNTCIINQKLGSWLFLGVILTSLEFVARHSPANSPSAGFPAAHRSQGDSPSDDIPSGNLPRADIPAPDRCGTCTRCIVACPTQAIVAPGLLDSRLCISYLTIEKRGEIPEELRAGMGRHVFGCDICQDVCPWNRKAPTTEAEEFQPREKLVNPALEWLAEMCPEEFRAVFRGSPVRRAKRSGLRRNAVIAMGNSGDAKFIPALNKLSEDSDRVVAEHAVWALRRLEQGHDKRPGPAPDF